MSRRKGKGTGLADLAIDVTAPVQERIAAVVEATGGDPYHFRSGDVEVELAFAGEASVEEIIAHHVDLFGQPDKAATKPGHRPAVA